MKSASIAPAVIMREMARLLQVFPRPKYWPSDDAEVARRWAEVFDGVTEEQLVAAVTLYVREDHSFIPKPGQLRSLASKQRRYGSSSGSSRDDFEMWVRRGYRDAAGSSAPCPVCGRAWQWQPRLVIVHNHAKHREAGVACELACDEPKCLSTYGHAQGQTPERASAGDLWYAPAMVAIGPPPPGEPLALPAQESA